MATYNWEEDIEPNLHKLKPVAGGFSNAKRGLLKLESGEDVFIKIAEDDDTKKWIKKEIEVYGVLGREGYQYAPKMLANSADFTGIAIQYMSSHQFDHPWDENMLREVMEARQALKALQPFFENKEMFNLRSVVDFRNRWPKLTNKTSIDRINRALETINSDIKIELELVNGYAIEMADWRPREDTLVHQDIRADNFGYSPSGSRGKLIDWNWLCIGDELMDLTPMFVNVKKDSSVDPYSIYPECYSRSSLLYVIGYWLSALAEIDISEDISSLRKHQASSAVVALSMLKQ